MATRTGSLLRPLSQPQNLTRALVERLAGDIASGRLAPGARLPTEAQMVAAMGVSRTVVREAVAALRADGLVLTRQGIGAFVAPDVQRRPFRIDPDGLTSIDEVVHLMELRMGFEVEAAGLAAERATPARRRTVGHALRSIDAAIQRGSTAVDEDFAFHQSIAAATGNPQYPRLLEFLGRFIIPRQSVRVTAGGADERRRYLDLIQAEHQAIFDAIEGADPDAARAAMRAHLVNGRNRYQKLVNRRRSAERPATTA